MLMLIFSAYCVAVLGECLWAPCFNSVICDNVRIAYWGMRLRMAANHIQEKTNKILIIDYIVHCKKKKKRELTRLRQYASADFWVFLYSVSCRIQFIQQKVEKQKNSAEAGCLKLVSFLIFYSVCILYLLWAPCFLICILWAIVSLFCQIISFINT